MNNHNLPSSATAVIKSYFGVIVRQMFPSSVQWQLWFEESGLSKPLKYVLTFFLFVELVKSLQQERSGSSSCVFVFVVCFFGTG